MSCQPGHHVVASVSEQRWKYRWAAYKSFDETGKVNILMILLLWFLGTKGLQLLQQYDLPEAYEKFQLIFHYSFEL